MALTVVQFFSSSIKLDIYVLYSNSQCIYDMVGGLKDKGE